MERKIGVVGLGYVGLPVAVDFGEKMPAIGFDRSKKGVISLPTPIDPDKTPNLDAVIKASRIVGRNLIKSSSYCGF